MLLDDAGDETVGVAARSSARQGGGRRALNSGGGCRDVELCKNPRQAIAIITAAPHSPAQIYRLHHKQRDH